MTTNLSAYALATEQTSEIVCAYASSPRTLPAFSADRWVAIGSFKVPFGVSARLEVIGHKTSGVTACEVAVFGPQKIAESAVFVTTGSDEISRSAVAAFVPSQIYVIAARVRGTPADDAFAVISTVSLGDA